MEHRTSLHYPLLKEFFNIFPEDKKGLPNDREVECDYDNGICYPSVFLQKGQPSPDNEEDLEGCDSDEFSYFDNDVKPIYDTAVSKMVAKLTNWIEHYMKRFLCTRLYPELKMSNHESLYKKIYLS